MVIFDATLILFCCQLMLQDGFTDQVVVILLCAGWNSS